MNKKITFLLLATLIVALFVGCATTVSTFGGSVYDVESTQKDASIVANVLGPVHLEKEYNTGASYSDIFLEAKRLYPTVDEVINIHIDYAQRSSDRKAILTGIAIEYK